MYSDIVRFISFYYLLLTQYINIHTYTSTHTHTRTDIYVHLQTRPLYNLFFNPLLHKSIVSGGVLFPSCCIKSINHRPFLRHTYVLTDAPVTLCYVLRLLIGVFVPVGDGNHGFVTGNASTSLFPLSLAARGVASAIIYRHVHLFMFNRYSMVS